MNITRHGFSTGIITPDLDGRIDLDAYHRACRTLDNFQLHETGAISRRTGSKHLATLPQAPIACKAILWSNNNTELILIYPTTIEIRSTTTGETLHKTTNLPPRTTARIYQINDLLYILSEDQPPLTIKNHGTLYEITLINEKHSAYSAPTEAKALFSLLDYNQEDSCHLSITGDIPMFQGDILKINYDVPAISPTITPTNALTLDPNATRLSDTTLRLGTYFKYYNGATYVTYQNINSPWTPSDYNPALPDPQNPASYPHKFTRTLINIDTPISVNTPALSTTTYYTGDVVVYQKDNYWHYYTALAEWRPEHKYNPSLPDPANPASYPDIWATGLTLTKPTLCGGAWEYIPSGDWRGEYAIDGRDTPDGTWYELGSVTALTEKSNKTLTGNEQQHPIWLRLRVIRDNDKNTAKLANLWQFNIKTWQAPLEIHSFNGNHNWEFQTEKDIPLGTNIRFTINGESHNKQILSGSNKHYIVQGLNYSFNKTLLGQTLQLIDPLNNTNYGKAIITKHLGGSSYCKYRTTPGLIPPTYLTASLIHPGLWGGTNGYPTSIALHQGRIAFAGAKGKPQTLALSATDDFFNFRTGTDTTDAMIMTLSTTQQNRILWLSSSGGALIVGTTEAEYAIRTGNGAVLSSKTAVAERHTSCGSTPGHDAIHAHDALLYLDRSTRRLRRISYSLDSDTYNSKDLSTYSLGLLSGNLRSSCYQRTPYPTAWLIPDTGTNAGKLCGLLYNPDQQLTAWFTWDLGNTLHITTTPTGNIHDPLYLITNPAPNQYHLETIDYIERDTDGTDGPNQRPYTATLITTQLDTPDSHAKNRQFPRIEYLLQNCNLTHAEITTDATHYDQTRLTGPTTGWTELITSTAGNKTLTPGIKIKHGHGKILALRALGDQK